MDWKNASKGHLPANDQEVLISVDNVKYIAVYDAEANGFYLKDQRMEFLAVKAYEIYWTEYK